MIYTITFSPAVDYVIKLDSLTVGQVNRTSSEEIYFGGKGINVSCVLKELGIESKALGFVAGFTGEALEEDLKSQGIDTDFIHLKNGNTRINIKIKADKETEINGQGPEIDSNAIEQLFRKLDMLKEGDMLILSGSIPKSMPSNIYEKILERLQDRGIKFIVDATKDLLLNVLKYKPFLIKPNNFELEEIFGTEMNTDKKIIAYAEKLQQMGAVNVLVSMAEGGSILIDENGNVNKMGICSGEVINSVGAGDSMVAGFAAGHIKKSDYIFAHKLGTACGGATAFSSGLAQKELINKLLAEIESDEIL
ncbi:MAG: 1-phosphofructokinase [Oscillospiraceae bacterium]